MTWAYYNEIDPYAAAWLRNLIAAGHIAEGEVDERSIVDVRPDDLTGFSQCHFFAGIGVWSEALRRAGWPDDRQVWTGSCPCQPFSAAGKGEGFADERHLWPAWHWLIEQRRPDAVFGEQVASPDGLAWLDLVQSDMEGSDYAFRPHDLCAAGFGAPGLRQRLYFVAESGSERREGLGIHLRERGSLQAVPEAARSRSPSGMVNAELAGLEGHAGHGANGDEPGRIATLATGSIAAAGDAGGVGDSSSGGCGEQWGQTIARRYGYPDIAERNSAVRGFWDSAEWVLCRDPRGPKWRAVEPGAFPLAARTPTRVGRLRAYGNAINAQVASGFIEAYLDCVR